MFTYFIYYTFKKAGMKGDGNADIKVDCEITCMESVQKIEQALINELGFDSVVVCNFKEFPDR